MYNNNLSYIKKSNVITWWTTKKVSPSHKKKYIRWILCIIWLSWIWYVWWWTTKNTPIIEKQVSTYVTIRDTILIWSEWQWNIQGNDLVTLNFNANERITEILVRPWDVITPDDILAKQDTTSLYMSLQQAQNSYAQSQASYNQKINPLSANEKQQIEKEITSSDISYSEKLLQIENDLVSLEQTKQDAETKVEQLLEESDKEINDNDLTLRQQQEELKILQSENDLKNEADDMLNDMKDFLYEADLFLWISNLNKSINDGFESSLSAKNTSIKREAETSWKQINTIIQTFHINSENTEALLDSTNTLLSIWDDVKKLASSMVEILEYTSAWSRLTDSELNSFHNTFSNLESSIRQAYNNLANQKENFTIAQNNYIVALDTATDSSADRLSDIETQVENAETDLKNTQRSYELKLQELEQIKQRYDIDYEITQLNNSINQNPLSQDEATIAALQVQASKLSLQEKQLSFDSASLKSPVAWIIVSINNSIGEYPWSDFITIATEWEKYISVMIEEEEVISIEVGQQVEIIPDVYENLQLAGKVWFVSLAWETDNNWIVSYEVVIYPDENDTRLKSGMNVSVEFIAQQAENVLVVPIKAVFPYENSPHVTLKDWTLRKIVSGLSDGKLVEIISGLEVGERILVEG